MADRSTRFRLKRSNVLGKSPSLGDLKLGELAMNTADMKLYGGYTGGATGATEVRQIGWDKVSITGDTMTGTLFAPTISATTISATTYFGDGSNLTGIPDVYVTAATFTSGVLTLTRNDDVDVTANIPAALKMKSGTAIGTGFTGNPKIEVITFITPFVDNDYSVTITGEDSRSWTVDSKTASGFTINANANPAFVGEVYWQAIKTGEN